MNECFAPVLQYLGGAQEIGVNKPNSLDARIQARQTESDNTAQGVTDEYELADIAMVQKPAQSLDYRFESESGLRDGAITKPRKIHGDHPPVFR